MYSTPEDTSPPSLPAKIPLILQNPAERSFPFIYFSICLLQKCLLSGSSVPGTLLGAGCASPLAIFYVLPWPFGQTSATVLLTLPFNLFLSWLFPPIRWWTPYRWNYGLIPLCKLSAQHIGVQKMFTDCWLTGKNMSSFFGCVVCTCLFLIPELDPSVPFLLRWLQSLSCLLISYSDHYLAAPIWSLLFFTLLNYDRRQFIKLHGTPICGLACEVA